MNKDKLKKNLYAHVKLRPVARRFNNSVELVQIDDDWIIEEVSDVGVKITNISTGHTTRLGYDHIHHYDSNPDKEFDGLKHGFLSLNVQIFFDESKLWIEPISVRR